MEKLRILIHDDMGGTTLVSNAAAVQLAQVFDPRKDFTPSWALDFMDLDDVNTDGSEANYTVFVESRDAGEDLLRLLFSNGSVDLTLNEVAFDGCYTWFYKEFSSDEQIMSWRASAEKDWHDYCENNAYINHKYGTLGTNK